MPDLPRPKFDPTINLGHILTGCSFIVVGLVAFFAVRSDVSQIDVRVRIIEDSVKSMATSMAKLADAQLNDIRQEERISNNTRRIENNERRIDRLENTKEK